MDKSSDISCLSVDEANAVVSNADYEVIPGSVTVYRNASNDYVLAFENESEMPRLEHMPYLQRHAFIVIILVLTILMFLINRFWLFVFIEQHYMSLVCFMLQTIVQSLNKSTIRKKSP